MPGASDVRCRTSQTMPRASDQPGQHVVADARLFGAAGALMWACWPCPNGMIWQDREAVAEGGGRNDHKGVAGGACGAAPSAGAAMGVAVAAAVASPAPARAFTAS
eukprot:358837-Chlamydomonas_euryale.AAC.3